MRAFVRLGSCALMICWLALLPFCSALGQEAESLRTLNYVGSSTIGNFISDAQPSYPDADFRINTATESAGGERAIAEGRCDLAGVAREPSKALLATGVNATLIGYDAIAVLVNETNPVQNLSTAQLKSIFTGAYSNWNQVGGPDLAIKRYIVEPASATRNVFRSKILGEADYSGCNVVKPDVNVLRSVQNEPGAIGHVSHSFIGALEGARAISVDGHDIATSADYPITRPLYLLWWPGRASVEAFINWIETEDGQRMLQRRFLSGTDAAFSFPGPPVLKYTGSSTVGIFVQNAAAQYKDVQFDISTATETAGGEQSILAGTTDIAGIARVPQASVLSDGVVSTFLGMDAITVIVHKDINRNNISLARLADLFTGEITNWKDLGGPDLPVRPFIVAPTSATHAVFQRTVLGGGPYKGCTVVAPDPAIIDSVARIPGAVGHISLGFLSGNQGVNTMAVEAEQATSTNLNYPITRPLYLLSREGNPVVEAFVAWTQQPAGQRILMEHYVGIPGISLGIARTPTQRKGALEVYTATSPIEDAGLLYYPYTGYDVFDTEGNLIRHVANRLGDYDEKPSRIILPTGNYVIKPDVPVRGITELTVQVLTGQTTRVDFETAKNTTSQPTQAATEGTETQKEDRLRFYGDMRFRIEHDWNNRRPNGDFNDNRTRLRYRARLGFYYRWGNYVGFGARLRTGNITDQQGPHVTLGSGSGEFGLVPLGFDKAFIEYRHPKLEAWVGKNSWPFWKQNELFWNDNVLPEGAYIAKRFWPAKNNSWNAALRTGYFVINAASTRLQDNSYLAATQGHVTYTGKSWSFNAASGYYFFYDLPLVPATRTDTLIDYQLIISSAELKFKFGRGLALGADVLTNIDSYAAVDEIPIDQRTQTNGLVISAKYGALQRKGDVLFHVYLASMQRFSAVDYFAQNDWARWDYSSQNVAGSRLTNFEGVEFRLGYAFGPRFKLVARSYFVEQLIPTGPFTETGNRIRLDLDIGF